VQEREERTVSGVRRTEMQKSASSVTRCSPPGEGEGAGGRAGGPFRRRNRCGAHLAFRELRHGRKV
jgi:hypothetical protein